MLGKTNWEKIAHHLSGPTARPPPIALEGIATPAAPMFFRDRKVSRYTPPPKFALSHPRGGVAAVSQLKLPLEGIALYGGIAEIVSPFDSLMGH